MAGPPAMVDQNLQQMIPFLQTRCRPPLRLRSAFAILTGLLVHSLCNLRVRRTKKNSLMKNARCDHYHAIETA
jgi:hypothetical protein